MKNIKTFENFTSPSQFIKISESNTNGIIDALKASMTIEQAKSISIAVSKRLGIPVDQLDDTEKVSRLLSKYNSNKNEGIRDIISKTRGIISILGGLGISALLLNLIKYFINYGSWIEQDLFTSDNTINASLILAAIYAFSTGTLFFDKILPKNDINTDSVRPITDPPTGKATKRVFLNDKDRDDFFKKREPKGKWWQFGHRNHMGGIGNYGPNKVIGSRLPPI